MKNQIVTLLIFLSFSSLAFSQEIEMSGTIFDSEINIPIEFVNIGILNKNKGTVSNQNGKYNLNISKEFLEDSLTFSHVSYESFKILIKDFKNQTVFLQPKNNELSEVVVTNKKKKKRKIGVESYNPLLWLRAISENNDIIENAQRINIPNETTVKVKYVNIYLRRGFKTDSCFMRINFYKNLDNAPGERIIFDNIIQNKRIEPGWLQIDLTKSYIYIDEDFFVGVEFLPDFKNTKEVYLGAILSKGKGYNRSSSQGKWNKLQGASTINIEVEY